MSASAEITINPMMEAAELYALRGYTAMPVDPHTKRPSVPDWTTRRSMPADYWSGPGADLNICLVGGGGGILIVDLDGITYEEAAKYLPPTDAREGRKSSPSTHLVYDIIPEDWPEDALPKAGSAVRAAMDAGRIPRFPGVRHYKGTMERGGKRVGIDVLGAGGQANVAPSLHPSGERRQWHPDGRMRLPARVRWCDLIEAVERLVGQFGWRRPEPKSQAEADHDDLIVISDLGTGFPEDPAAEEFVEACRIELQRMAAAVSGKGGGLQTWKAAMTAADHGLDKDQALTVLTEWNTRCQPPWSGADLRTTLQRAYTGERINPIGYKQQETRKMEALASAGAEAMTLPAFATASGTSEAMIGSDIANGEAFAEDHADLVRYSPDGGGWYVFDGQRWALDTGDLKVQEMAKVTAKRLRIEAATEPNEDKRKRLMRYTERASSAAGIHAMLDMAHSIPAIALPVAAFDDPDRTRYLLNTPGGIIDLRTNDRKAHDPSLYITKMAGCDANGTEQHPMVDKVLDHLSNHDPAVRDCLERTLGMAATGDTSAKVLMMLGGPPDCGKGTALEAMRATLGDYACVAPVELFVDAGSTGRATPEIAMLKGGRFAYANETEEGGRLDADKLKRLVGGDERIVARPLWRPPMEFTMTAMLALATNANPWINDTDDAMWRRLLFFAPQVSVEVSARDPALKSALQRDLDVRRAFLATLIRGAGRWWRDGGGIRGLAVPPALEAARARYRAEQDPIAGFIDSEAALRADLTWTRKEAREAYVTFAKTMGVSILSDRALGTRLRALPGVSEAYIERQRGWQGIGPRYALAISQPLREEVARI